MTFYFGHKKRTVIHRRNVSRPSILYTASGRANPNESAASIKSSPETSSPDKSHSLSPPLSASTAPTSLTDLASLGSGDRPGSLRSALPQTVPPGGGSLRWNADASASRGAQDSQRGSDETTLSKSSGTAAQGQVFPLAVAPLSVTPSIATLETAAAAKSFFEVHFNVLRSEAATPRQQRWQALEDRLSMMSVSFEERQEALGRWLRAESEYLRQLRVWKGKSLARRKAKGISIAGYEVVRVLGKGSFGLVKLVKERPLPPPRSLPIHSDDSDIEMLDGIGATADCPVKDVKDVAHLAKQVYAMKVIRKSDMLRNCQEGHLKAERDFLVASESSRWVVPLIASFQDNSNLYLVMEYMVGGDFLGLLLREDVLSEYAATWYIAEMILCIEEAHKMNWIHRDVKPDNFLITASGHLKISDFGLAFDGHWAHNQTYFNNQRYSLLDKFGIRVRGDAQDEDDELARAHARSLGTAVNDALGRPYRPRRPSWMDRHKSEDPLAWLNRTQRRRLAKSVVGTSQYMAPEVIRGEEYDGRADWWSVGIILYECLYGSTPFYSETRQATKEKIVRHTEFLHFPNEPRFNRPTTPDRTRLPPVSFAALNLLCNLLTAKEHRLSARHYAGNDMPEPCQRRGFPARGARFVSAPPAPPPQRHFVQPDDAADIKAHPLFRGIDWANLHRMAPPFVPRIRREGDLTRYFEDEAEIVGSEGCGESSDYEEGEGEGEGGCEGEGEGEEGGRRAMDMDIDAGAGAGVPKRARKEMKRPRDKLLRDPLLGRCVLEARKKGAFVGYTYRRPSEGVRAGIL